jgi:hypothetical protein
MQTIDLTRETNVNTIYLKRLYGPNANSWQYWQSK